MLQRSSAISRGPFGKMPVPDLLLSKKGKRILKPAQWGLPKGKTE
jgi:hypothetical protein